ncbi:MAG: FAD-binding domain [Candidatus Palauibacterales bacterium]|nr:FAD-binding domain [Candidatus Palauibacterales bacterium]
MKIAIQGAGIGGPTLAYWLHRAGHEPTLIEEAPRLRTGGYVIDFWGVGYTIAERMGILPEVLEAGYSFGELRLLDARGRRVGGFSTDVFRRMTGGRFTSLPRGDLAAAIYRAVEGRVETLFGESITSLEEADGGVRVTLDGGATRDFDLVVGADGLHSRVRRLVFGPEERFEKRLGYRVATFEVEGYRPRDELVYVAHAEPGRQLARIALRGDRTVFLLVFRADVMQRPEPTDLEETRALLREVFGESGWEAPRILDAIDAAPSLYYDRVSQIRMPAWSRGRVMLVGDAAAAVSLLAGEGTGLAMTEAYVLAGELGLATGDFRAAFRSQEARLRPFVEGKQEAAEGFASSFLPRTRMGIWFRNQVTRVMGLPGVAEFTVGRTVADDVELPEYAL